MTTPKRGRPPKHESLSRELRERLDALEKAKRALRREERRKCDWSVQGSVLEYVRVARREEREALLDRLVKDRKCPSCRVVRPNSRSWVVLRENQRRRLVGSTDETLDRIGRTGVVCRSCAMTRLKGIAWS